MTSLFLLGLTLAADSGKYPLSAAFAVNGRVVIARMGSEKHEELEGPTGRRVVSADLHPDKSAIIAEVRADGEESALYLYDRSRKSWSAIETGLVGSHKTPRYTPDGRHFVFACSNAVEGGPEHPTQVWRLEASKPRSAPVRLSTQTEYCHFSPAPLDADRFASVGTNCYFDFELRLSNRTSQKPTKLAATHSAADELAASFDGKTLLRIEKLDADFVFTTFRDGKSKQVYSFRGKEGASGQPRFVCPRDAMFLENGVARVINTKTGEVKTVGEGMP